MLVVAAAILRDGRVLAARRSRPDHLAGGWEFPGGKVEAGEDEASALGRECREELATELVIGAHLDTVAAGELTLALYAATIYAGEPSASTDHDELRWLNGEQLEDVDWLPIDRELLPAVRRALSATG